MKSTFTLLLALALCLGIQSIQAQKSQDTPSIDGEMVMEQDFFHHSSLALRHSSSIVSRENGFDLDPGIAPDGDEQGTSTFTNDGNRIISTNGLTNNVTIFDWDTRTALANVDVGEYPVHVTVSDNYAVISCLFDSAMYVMDLDDYSIAAVLEMPGETFSSTISPGGSKVYGHCFSGDHSTVEVYDMDTFSHLQTIDNLPALPYSQSWITGSGRTSFNFFSFVISYANNLLITPDASNNILFYDLNSGELQSQISGIRSLEVELSLDENTLVTIATTNPDTLYQINVSTQSIIDEFPLTIGYWAGSLSCNADGTRAFIGGDNSGHIIDFSDDSHEVFNTNTAFCSATTPDKRYVYSSNYKASVLDFDTKSVVGIHQGNTQGYVCVSPVGYKAFAYNNLFWEGGFFYDFSSLSSLNYLGKEFFGNPPEGDVPFRVAITPDGMKAIVTNPGSWTASIVDLTTNEITSVLELGEACKFVEISHDGSWAVASGYDENTVKIINLNTEEVVAHVTTGSRPGNMAISPDDQYVYVKNIKANTISKVLLDGENSTEVTEFACGTIGGYYSAYGIQSNLAVSPDGNYLIACITFENHVKIIETAGMTSVAELNTGNNPLHVALNESGDYATVTNYSDDTYSVIHFDGANSSIVDTYGYGLGNPIRVKYNAVRNEMLLVDYQHTNLQWKVLHTDPETGMLLETEIHDGYGATLDAGYHSDGSSVILTGAQPLSGGAYGDSHVLMDNQDFVIGPGPIAFDVNPARNIAVCACGGGGPDYISIVYLDPVSIEDLNTDEFPIGVYPNPTTNILNINAHQDIVKLSIYDMSGSLVFAEKVNSDQEQLCVEDLPAGQYFLQAHGKNGVCTVVKIIKR